MQTGKNAASSVKETAANIAASAKSGKDKTKATVQEKVEKMTAHDPMEKEMAKQRKEEKIIQAEINKQETRERNAALSHQAGGVTTGQPTGVHQTSVLPGHATGQPQGQVTEGVLYSHPMGTNTGTGGTTAQNPRVGGDANQGYMTGGGYS